MKRYIDVWFERLDFAASGRFTANRYTQLEETRKISTTSNCLRAVVINKDKCNMQQYAAQLQETFHNL